MMEHSVIFPDHRKVCALGQGTWKMGKSALREADEIDALRAGIELGMSVVDTAEMYGNEEMVGAAIRGLRDRVFLVTKVLPGNASRTGTKAVSRTEPEQAEDGLRGFVSASLGRSPSH